jgi:hypothetical protein
MDGSVSAEVLLRTASGRSLADSRESVTAENVDEYRPAPETALEATRLLQELGFQVLPSGITLTLVGDPKRFEDVFGVRLSIQEQPSGQSAVSAEGEPRIPESLQPFVDAVVFPEPPEYFT